MNTYQLNGVCHLEIWEPSPIVISISKNTYLTSIVQFEFLIHNEAPVVLPFIPFSNEFLIPELLDSDKQLLLPQKLISKQPGTNLYKGIGIPPCQSLVRYLLAKLLWQNDRLQLQIFIDEVERLPESIADFHYYWLFEYLKLENYQFRFSYKSPAEEFSFFNADTKEICQVRVSELEYAPTHWVNLRLVEPLVVDNSTVEVDGICFQTVILDRISTVSLTQSDSKIYIPIGMQITNNTSTPLRFFLFDSLIPTLIGKDGQIVLPKNGGASYGFRIAQESDSQLAIPGQIITLFPGAYLTQQADGLLKLYVPGRGRSVWWFENLQPGTYQVQLTYKTPIELIDPGFIENWMKGKKFEDLWVGMVCTPFVKLHLKRFLIKSL